ncbi:MAG: ABC transporter substrate-binding protein [Spirosomataceae bacterium]
MLQSYLQRVCLCAKQHFLQVKLGFIPLTDCAPLVAAKELGLFQKYGVDVVLSKEASWANIRDKSIKW